MEVKGMSAADKIAANAKGYQNAEKEKMNLEFSRYKQDCRKRAFEMAHSEMSELLRRDKGGEFSVTETADKYYNWLISIPE